MTDDLTNLTKIAEKTRAIKNAIESEQTGTAAIKAKADANGSELGCIKALVQANEKAIRDLQGTADPNTGIAGLRALVQANEKAITDLQGSADQNTGIAGLRAMVQANRPNQGSPLATKTDLDDLGRRLIERDDHVWRWHRDHRVGWAAVAAALAMLALEVLSFAGCGLAGEGQRNNQARLESPSSEEASRPEAETVAVTFGN